jgi:hypothetical protein
VCRGARFVSLPDRGASPFDRAELLGESDTLQPVDELREQECSLARRPRIDDGQGDVHPLEPDDEVGGAEILARERARSV